MSFLSTLNYIDCVRPNIVGGRRFVIVRIQCHCHWPQGSLAAQLICRCKACRDRPHTADVAGHARHDTADVDSAPMNSTGNNQRKTWGRKQTLTRRQEQLRDVHRHLLDQRAAGVSFNGAKLCDLTRHDEVHSNARARRTLSRIIRLRKCKVSSTAIREEVTRPRARSAIRRAAKMRCDE